MSELQWKKQPPNKEGHWLRVNAAGRVELHCIFKDSPHDQKLSIYWGWSPQSKQLIKNIKAKLICFWWYGPLPKPPNEAVEPRHSKAKPQR